MEIKRYRVVAIGANTPNVLSEISQSLSLHNYEIETISSLRLGHSIVVICLVEATQNKNVIKNCLKSIVDKYDMKLIVDQTSRDKYKFIKSDAFLRIRGHHEAGIKAYVISKHHRWTFFTAFFIAFFIAEGFLFLNSFYRKNHLYSCCFRT